MMRQGKIRGLVPVILGIYIFILYGPVLLLPLFSFNDNIYMTFPIRDLTLKWYGQMIEEKAMITALWASVKVTAAIASTIFGFMSARPW